MRGRSDIYLRALLYQAKWRKLIEVSIILGLRNVDIERVVEESVVDTELADNFVDLSDHLSDICTHQSLFFQEFFRVRFRVNCTSLDSYSSSCQTEDCFCKLEHQLLF